MANPIKVIFLVKAEDFLRQTKVQENQNTCHKQDRDSATTKTRTPEHMVGNASMLGNLQMKMLWLEMERFSKSLRSEK